MSLTRDELDTLIAAAVQAGLADLHRRPQLFLGLPPPYAPSLQRHLNALDQLRWDLGDLSRHSELEGHPLPPLVTWLRNAEGMALPPEAAVFRGFRERLSPPAQTPPALPVMPGTRNLVFVAYDHRDEALKDALLPHLAPLRRWGGMEVWDDRQLKAADEWYPRIRDVLGRTRVALCLVSKHFLDSDFCMEEELPYLLQQHWAGQLEVLPILVGPCAWRRHPWLARLDAWPADDAALARLVEAIGDALDRGGPVVPAVKSRPLPEKVDLSRLPESGHLLLGRAAEWNLLDAALLGPETRMVVLRAPGGVGKSTLVKAWTDALQSRGLPGLERAYAWSFYSQGTGERVTSADLFIAKALEFFGDPDPKQGDPWEKGERLASLIAEQPTLLVLDGLEPLQEGGIVERGRIKDPSLLTLLEGLADKNQGLCLVTTREALVDLRDAAGVRHFDLEHLSALACRALLRIAGVRGEDRALEQAAADLGHHALAITLLASWLREFPDRDIAHAAALPALETVSVEAGRHPRRVMEAWAERLRERGEHAALELLHVLGLFDRPAEVEAIQAVIWPPVIDGLSGSLTSETLNGALGVLRSAHLVVWKGHQAQAQLEVDAHPLVREHFGARLLGTAKSAWRDGHERLFNYYCGQTLRRVELSGGPFGHLFLPYLDDVHEANYLIQGISHASNIGRHRDAWRVYFGGQIENCIHALAHEFGAFTTDLAALRYFFAQPWTQPVEGPDHAVLLNHAGCSLRALGHLPEAVGPMEATVRLACQRGLLPEASVGAGELSRLLTILGRLREAHSWAVRAKAFSVAARYRLPRAQEILAAVLHQRGRLQAARKLLDGAEEGYEHYDLLLTLGEFRPDDLRMPTDPWLDEASLFRVVQGRALTEAPKLAQEHFDAAATGLRKAGTRHLLPTSLLARASFFRTQDCFDLAHRDLAEVHKIATRGGMRLHLCDFHLESARLHLAEGHLDLARRHHATAHAEVHAMGYHRRDPELAELAAALGPVSGATE